MITIEEALELACMLHKGQTDLEGNPEILHPLTVGLAGKNREEIITGFLHDVVEDTDCTFADLEGLGVDTEIVEALKLLTHNKSKMTYREYVQAIADSGNQLAIRVKRNDIIHNLKRGRAHGHTSLVKKHEMAMAIILKAV